jgi:hypothetical protein
LAPADFFLFPKLDAAGWPHPHPADLQEQLGSAKSNNRDPAKHSKNVFFRSIYLFYLALLKIYFFIFCVFRLLALL